MLDGSLPLKGHNVAVVGFNARPIACSILKAGATPFVSDYWGDSDLANCCERWISVLQPKPGFRQREKLEKPVNLCLVDNLLDLVEGLDVDYALIGSGFDDFSQILAPIHKQIGIKGNAPEMFRRARNMKMVRKIATKHGLHFPKRFEFRDYDSALKGCERIGYPCVIRPATSGGGARIVFVRKSADILRFFKKGVDQEIEGVVQQYISGIDMSCSVLSTGSIAVAISCQGQLIGIPSAGRNCDFVYCGNYFPVRRNPEVLKSGKKIAAEICKDMSLVGSNGVDMILDSQNRFWILEINPRIQGSLELLEMSGNISVTALHVSSCNGHLPTHSFSYSPGVKMIVYSRHEGIIQDLSQHANAADVPLPGVCVKRGDPICSVLTTGPSLKECYSKSCTDSKGIRNAVDR